MPEGYKIGTTIMRHLTARQKKSTVANKLKGYTKDITNSLKNMQYGEEKEMAAERTWELDEAKRDIEGCLDDIIERAEAIIRQVKFMKEIYG